MNIHVHHNIKQTKMSALRPLCIVLFFPGIWERTNDYVQLGTKQQKDGFIIVEDHKNVKKMLDPPLNQSKKMLDPPL